MKEKGKKSSVGSFLSGAPGPPHHATVRGVWQSNSRLSPSCLSIFGDKQPIVKEKWPKLSNYVRKTKKFWG